MAWPKRARKWLEGEKICFPSELFGVLEFRTFVFWRHHLMHVAVVANWSYRALSIGVRNGLFHYAEINPEWKKENLHVK